MNAYTPDPTNIESVFENFPRLETERLVLREIVEEDAEALLTVFADEEVMRYYDLYPYTTVDEARALIDFFVESFEVERGIRWGIARKADNVLIGTCGYVWLRRFRGEIGYELGRAHWRQGYMSEAIQAMVRFGVEQLGLNRVEALVMVENEASAGVLTHLGFQQEGILRQQDHFKDAFHDMRLFSILKDDLR